MRMFSETEMKLKIPTYRKFQIEMFNHVRSPSSLDFTSAVVNTKIFLLVLSFCLGSLWM